ncbi:MAG TPA: hypothetical protein VJU61_11185 [Polyangiaceae bacterium]|nr:hypothetical protein [Polyangiaceae bacterium]
MKKAWTRDLEERVKQRVGEAKQHVEAVAQRLAELRTPKEAASGSAPTPTELRAPSQGSEALAEDPELPVVARLIVEIRSDGTRTLARGALEDVMTGERVALEAKGGSPMQLAASLAGSLLTTPFALGRAATAAMRRRLGGTGER